MRAIGVVLATLVSAVCLTVAASVAFSCGFEDPKSASAARGILNFMYPKALYVSTAVWRAQLDGVIACDDPPQKDRSIVAGRSKYDMAVAHLARLHDKLSGGLDGSPKPAFSLVLLGPMLWTRFVPEGHGIAMTPHVNYAEANDVVIVTDQPVIAALVEGRMSSYRGDRIGPDPLLRSSGQSGRADISDRWVSNTELSTCNASNELDFMVSKLGAHRPRCVIGDPCAECHGDIDYQFASKAQCYQ